MPVKEIEDMSPLTPAERSAHQDRLKKLTISQYSWLDLGSDEDMTDPILPEKDVARLAAALDTVSIRTIGDIVARPDDAAVALTPWELRLVELHMGRDKLPFGEPHFETLFPAERNARIEGVFATRIDQFKWRQSAIEVAREGDDDIWLEAVRADPVVLGEKLAALRVETVADLYLSSREDIERAVSRGEMAVIDTNLAHHGLWLSNKAEITPKNGGGFLQRLKNNIENFLS